jgi:starch synthase (maltosyl-transferring)
VLNMIDVPGNLARQLARAVRSTHPDVHFAVTSDRTIHDAARSGTYGATQYLDARWQANKTDLVALAENMGKHADIVATNLFGATADHLHKDLQTGGPSMFAIRATLAATLSTSWGINAGFELFEREPSRPGSTQYRNAELYELRPREFAAATPSGHSLQTYITSLNQIRRSHRAFRQVGGADFHDTDSDRLIAYSRADLATGDTVLVIVTLDAHDGVRSIVDLNMAALGREWTESFEVTDEISGTTRWLTARFEVNLEPRQQVALIMRIPRVDQET